MFEQDGVGMTAINDAIMVNNSLFLILKKNFSECENYLKMVELFNEVSVWFLFCLRYSVTNLLISPDYPQHCLRPMS